MGAHGVSCDRVVYLAHELDMGPLLSPPQRSGQILHPNIHSGFKKKLLSEMTFHFYILPKFQQFSSILKSMCMIPNYFTHRM